MVSARSTGAPAQRLGTHDTHISIYEKSIQWLTTTTMTITTTTTDNDTIGTAVKLHTQHNNRI